MSRQRGTQSMSRGSDEQQKGPKWAKWLKLVQAPSDEHLDGFLLVGLLDMFQRLVQQHVSAGVRVLQLDLPRQQVLLPHLHALYVVPYFRI